MSLCWINDLGLHFLYLFILQVSYMYLRVAACQEMDRKSSLRAENPILIIIEKI